MLFLREGSQTNWNFTNDKKKEKKKKHVKNVKHFRHLLTCACDINF